MEALTKLIQKAQWDTLALSQRNQELSETKKELPLKTSSYNCERCSDTGWILINRQDSAPLAVSCECRELEKLKSHWKASGINPETSKQTFSNFEVWNEYSRKAKDAAVAYYKDFHNLRSERRNSIMICGQVGSGKTHLTVALALNFINKKIQVVYMPYRDTVTKLKQNMLDEEYYRKTISKYQSAEVLLIDDLFKGKINDTDINIVFEILNYRYINHRPIIVSTEFSVEKLLGVDESIGSRIYEMCKDYIVEIGRGRDNNYRLR